MFSNSRTPSSHSLYDDQWHQDVIGVFTVSLVSYVEQDQAYRENVNPDHEPRWSELVLAECAGGTGRSGAGLL